jgi:hypothetical protein
MRVFNGVVLGVLLLASSAASASLSLDVSKSDFPKQRNAIREAVNPGGDLTEITSEDRRAVLARLSSIEQALADQGFDALAQEVRDAVHADQAAINEILGRAAADSRLICKNETKTGSNRLKRVCVTAAAQRRQYEQTQQQLNGATGDTLRRD